MSPNDVSYDVTEEESPESLVIPYEDINERQRRISGEAFLTTYWNYATIVVGHARCFNVKGKIENCPLCGNQAIRTTNDHRRSFSNRLPSW